MLEVIGSFIRLIFFVLLVGSPLILLYVIVFSPRKKSQQEKDVDDIFKYLWERTDAMNSELDKETETALRLLQEKYANLTPEEIIFSEDIEKENLPNRKSLCALPIFHNSFYLEDKVPPEGIRKILLYLIHKLSPKEIEDLLKTAKKSIQKAKLKTIKANIHKKANEMHGIIQGSGREPIPEEIQLQVWNRDGGKCVKCGSQEKLEFDHIIPVSKGGSNTARNIQLLCEHCNRSKSNNIGPV